MAATTYYVGRLGLVKRLDNLIAPWIDVSLGLSSTPLGAASQSLLNDVKTNPNNPAHVFVGGNVAGTGGPLFTSYNFGVTWQQAGGGIGDTPRNVYELSVINNLAVPGTATIFAACNERRVAKSSNNGVSYNYLSQIPISTFWNNATGVINPVGLPGQSVYSLNFIDDQVGIVGTTDRVWKTVNGGATWTEPNGGNIIFANSPTNTISCGNIYGIKISANQSTIVFVSSSTNSVNNNAGYIFRSTNGGLSYNVVYTFPPNTPGFHLTWLNDNELWATGGNNHRVRSTDGGATWTVLNTSTTTDDIYSAHFFTSSKGFYSFSSPSAGNGIVYSTNSGVSGLTYPEFYSINAVWTDYVPECYLLTNCNNPTNFFIVDNDLSASVGSVIKVCPNDLPNQPPIPAEASPITIVQNDPGTSSFTLISCCDSSIIKIVYNDLSTYLNNVIIVPSLGTSTCWTVSNILVDGAENLGLIDLTGGVYFSNCNDCTLANPCIGYIPNLTECDCFEISSTTNCENIITLTTIGPISDTCEDCYNYFQLTNCLDENDIKIVTNDLSAFVDGVIKIEGCPDTCWIVTGATTFEGSETIGTDIEFFEDCEECLPQDPPPVIPNLIFPRQVVPGYTTKACPPEYVEKVLCRYSDQMYRIMKEMRYGIATCCEEEFEKWAIKKNLLALDMINDPNPPKPECYCYTLTQNTGTNQFKYIDCSGNCQIITLLAEESVKVCAMYYPTVVCPTTNLDYTIQFCGTLCTVNEDCLPPPTYCVDIYCGDSAGAVVKYYQIIDGVCVSKNAIVKNVAYEETIYMCTDPTTIEIFASNPSLVIKTVSTTICDNDLMCTPCFCYKVTGNDINIRYIQCDGQPDTVKASGYVYICAKYNTITNTSGDATWVTDEVECTGVSEWECAPCYCYKLNYPEDYKVSYVDCNNQTQLFSGIGINYLCAKEDSIIELQGNPDPTTSFVECTNNTECIIYCYCYKAESFGVLSTISYIDCDKGPQVVTFAGTTFFCAEENSVVYPPTVTLTQGGACNVSLDCNEPLDCYCYTITPLVQGQEPSINIPEIPASYYYRACSGQVVQANLCDAPVTICAQEGSVVITGAATLSGPNTACTTNEDCQPCTCFTVTINADEQTIIRYMPCGEQVPTVEVYNFQAQTIINLCVNGDICIVEGNPVIVNSGVNCDSQGGCEPSCMCVNIYQSNFPDQVLNYSYVNCEGVLTSGSLNYQESINVCIQNIFPYTIPNIPYLSIPNPPPYASGVLCNDVSTNCQPLCTCYLVYVVNGDDNVIEYIDCSTDELATINASAGELITICSKFVPICILNPTNITVSILNVCDNNACDIPSCINWQISNNLYPEVTVTYTDCNNVIQTVTLYATQTIYICSIGIPTSNLPLTFFLPESQIPGLGCLP